MAKAEVEPVIQWIVQRFSQEIIQTSKPKKGTGKTALLAKVRSTKPQDFSNELIRKAIDGMFLITGLPTTPILDRAKEVAGGKMSQGNGVKIAPAVPASSSSSLPSSSSSTLVPSVATSSSSSPSAASSTIAVAAAEPSPARYSLRSASKADAPTTKRQALSKKIEEAKKADENRITIVNGMKMEHVDLWGKLQQISDSKDGSNGTMSPAMTKMLLFAGRKKDDAAGETSADFEFCRAIANAPLFSENIHDIVTEMEGGEKLLPQFAVLGITELPAEDGWDNFCTDEKLVYLNTNVPFSTFICGLQGGGKSHTLSVLLENSMVPEPLTGTLVKPLPAIVFHYSQFTSTSSFRPCEAAYLAKPSTDPDLLLQRKTVKSVRIYVSSSNHHNLKELYRGMADVSVSPLRFSSKDLTIGAMLQLMNVTESNEPPLYMAVVSKLLRDLATEDAGKFNYEKFKHRLMNTDLLPGQLMPLKMRLDLLESFVASGSTEEANVGNLFEAEEGVLHIVDLSCPFVDAETASTLFNICLDSFVGGAGKVKGLIVALDEAHKILSSNLYLTNKPASSRLTDSLLSLVRQQRHYGARVIISTQEPTVSPTLLDLCNVIVMHRFTSREWFSTIKKHLNVGNGKSRDDEEDAYNRIQDLGVGEALVFAPTAMLQKPPHDEQEETAAVTTRNITTFKLQVRKRITYDGGRSIMAV